MRFELDFSGPYFPAFGLNTERYFRTRENTDQKKLRIWTLLTQWKRLNVLNTLIKGGNKVKDILEKPSLDLDELSNEYLFREKFQEKLSEVTTVKQKSRSTLLVLHQKKMSPHNT